MPTSSVIRPAGPDPRSPQSDTTVRPSPTAPATEKRPATLS